MEKTSNHFRGKILPQMACSHVEAVPTGVGCCQPAEPDQNFLPSVLWLNWVDSVQKGVAQLNFLLWDCIDSDPSYFHTGY